MAINTAPTVSSGQSWQHAVPGHPQLLAGSGLNSEYSRSVLTDASGRAMTRRQFWVTQGSRKRPVTSYYSKSSNLAQFEPSPVTHSCKSA
jgi:hypothetical protein